LSPEENTAMDIDLLEVEWIECDFTVSILLNLLVIEQGFHHIAFYV